MKVSRDKSNKDKFILLFPPSLLFFLSLSDCGRRRCATPLHRPRAAHDGTIAADARQSHD